MHPEMCGNSLTYINFARLLSLSAMRNIFRKLAEILEIGKGADTPSQEKVSLSAMDDVAFWYIIDRCNNLTSSNEQYYNLLWSMLSEMNTTDVAEFAMKVEQSRQLLQTWNAWAAAKFIVPDLPKNMFHGFQSWIISAGKIAFQSTVNNEDNITDVLHIAGHRNLVFESFNRIPSQVLSQKLQSVQFDLDFGRNSDQEDLQGEHWTLTEANLTRRFPKLSTLLGRTPEPAGEPPLPTVH